MRNVLLVALLLACGPSWSQTVSPKLPEKPAAQPPCVDCAVIRSVRAVTRELRASPGSEAKPSGMVATVPLGGGSKGQVGSSTSLGKDSRPTDTRWEVTLRYDDGRLRVITLGEPPEVKEGDKVRVDREGTIRLRND
jgi:hypothetical protein